MSEEKKVLTPEEIADEISLMADFNTVESNKKHHIELKSKIERLIREYGEQQYTLGSHGLFEIISKAEVSQCSHENTIHRNVRCDCCQDCGIILEVDV